MPNDRLILHTVHTDDGATELYFARTADDFAPDVDGSLLFHATDPTTITFKCWTDEDIPIVVAIQGNRVRVGWAEDQPPDDDAVIFDTAKLTQDQGQLFYDSKYIAEA